MTDQIIRTAHGNCAACRKPFDPSDTRWDGHNRHGNTAWCRACVDRCHEADAADHRCPVCAGDGPFHGAPAETTTGH